MRQREERNGAEIQRELKATFIKQTQILRKADDDINNGLLRIERNVHVWGSWRVLTYSPAS